MVQTFLVLGVLAGLLFGLGRAHAAHRRARAATCSVCGARIEPAWHALVQGGELFCDEACYRTIPAVTRKAEIGPRFFRPWYSLRRRNDADA